MPTALDNARKAAAEKEAKLEAADAAIIAKLVDPTADLAAQFGAAAVKIRSRKGRVAMDRAVNAIRTALAHLEEMGERA